MRKSKLFLIIFGFAISLNCFSLEGLHSHYPLENEAILWRKLYSNPSIASYLRNENQKLLIKKIAYTIENQSNVAKMNGAQLDKFYNKLQNVILKILNAKKNNLDLSLKCIFCCGLCGGEGPGELGPCYHNCDVLDGCNC